MLGQWLKSCPRQRHRREFPFAPAKCFGQKLRVHAVQMRVAGGRDAAVLQLMRAVHSHAFQAFAERATLRHDAVVALDSGCVGESEGLEKVVPAPFDVGGMAIETREACAPWRNGKAADVAERNPGRGAEMRTA